MAKQVKYFPYSSSLAKRMIGENRSTPTCPPIAATDPITGEVTFGPMSEDDLEKIAQPLYDVGFDFRMLD